MRGDKRRIPLLTPDLQLPNLTEAPEEPRGLMAQKGGDAGQHSRQPALPSGLAHGATLMGEP